MAQINMLTKEKIISIVGGILIISLITWLYIEKWDRKDAINKGNYTNAYVYKQGIRSKVGHYVNYRFLIKGNEYKGSSEQFNIKVGDSILIKYDPRDPNKSDVVVDSLESVKWDRARMEENKRKMVEDDY